MIFQMDSVISLQRYEHLMLPKYNKAIRITSTILLKGLLRNQIPYSSIELMKLKSKE